MGLLCLWPPGLLEGHAGRVGRGSAFAGRLSSGLVEVLRPVPAAACSVPAQLGLDLGLPPSAASPGGSALEAALWLGGRVPASVSG